MRRLALASCIVIAGLLLGGTAASAGGWAVTTLDPLPAVSPGEPVPVGFTIRQHGVTPVDMEGVALVVVAADGGPSLRFPARLDGPTGHYVADVQVPAGSHRWLVEQGMFGPQELGMLNVAATAPPLPAPDGGRPWQVADEVRWGLLAVTVVAAMAFVALLAWPNVASRSQPAR
jgi:hypothetical protein